MTLDVFRATVADAEARLSRWPDWIFVSVTIVVSLALSVFFFSPNFVLWNFSLEGHFETTRARAFLAQIESPFAPVTDVAMQWRLLPPLLAHALHLSPGAALTIPWAGLVFLLATVVVLLRRYGLSQLQSILGTALIATTSAVIVPTTWLGINDGWISAALLWVAFGRSRGSLVAACLLAPWVDERFVIGFPLAFCLRQLPPNQTGPSPTLAGLLRNLVGGCLLLAPYAVARLWLRAHLGSDQSMSFLASTLSGFIVWIPFAPLGWWMAFRVAWIPLLYAAFVLRSFARGFVPAIAATTLLVITVLAADLSRSAAIVLPLLVSGLVFGVRRHPSYATRALGLLLAVNLALPALHIVYNKCDLISPLPLELVRVFRSM